MTARTITERIYPRVLQAGDVIQYAGTWAIVRSVEKITNGLGRPSYRTVLAHESSGKLFFSPAYLTPNKRFIRKVLS